MKFLINVLLVCAALSSPFAGASGRGQDGYPLPWPFPWAKECPMNWAELDGNYLLSDSRNAEHLILRINVITKKGLRLVHVTRYSDKGKMLYDGSTEVYEWQKIISLYLNNMYGEPTRVWAVIKMHYQSSVASCTADHLVPILTVQVPDIDAPPDGVDYRMVKVGAKN